MMEFRPIKTEAEYEAALKEIDLLLDAQPGTLQGNRLEVWTTLVEAYENSRYPISLPDDPVEVIQYYMESRGWTRKDLGNCLGSRSRVSEILNRKRSLSLEMIRRLHTQLGIPTDLLIAPLPAFALQPAHRHLYASSSDLQESVHMVSEEHGQ